MRLLLVITILTLNITSQGQLRFRQTDSITVKNGTDTLHLAWTGGMNYSQFSAIDLNLDGKEDLLAFDRTFNQPLTFINTGSPGQSRYKYQPQYQDLFPPMTGWCLARDYNCDGKKDLFTYSPGGMSVYRNISDTILKFELVVQTLRGIRCNSSGGLSNNYIYVSSVDIPSISDIDNDGDLDILTFGIFGTTLEYHKNFSVEMGYGCDSLKFQVKNERWGQFSEDPSYCKIYLNQVLPHCPALGTPELSPYNPAYTDVTETTEEPGDRELRHTGSALMALDINGANSKDLLVSDISCKHITLLTNTGASPNLDSPMGSQDTLFPSYDVPIDLDLFPACYHLDVNNDGKRDLIVAPNSTTQAENRTGNWLYINTGTDLTPVFSHTQFGFLQNQMIETGEGALPILFDFTGDGKKDLIVANFGRFIPATGTYEPNFTAYENIGSSTHPTYSFSSANFANIFAAIGKQALYPTFGDLDNDGDEDMIVGDIDGNIHRFTNTAGAGNFAVFSFTGPLMQDSSGTVIDVGKNATPLLVDLDRDGDLDLVIGEQNATLNYYRNTGTPASAQFVKVTETLGGVDVSEFFTPVGFSVPSIYDHNGEYFLMVGSQKGVIYQYNNIDGNLTGTFDLIDSLGYDHKLGGRTGVALGDLNGDAYPDMLVGNYRGGLNLFFGKEEGPLTGIHQQTLAHTPLNLQVFPNPTSGRVTLRTNLPGTYVYSITDLNGRLVMSGNLQGNTGFLDIEQLENGLYFINVSDKNNRSVHKLIKSACY